MSRFLYDTIFILHPGQEIPDTVIDDALDKANPEAEIPVTQRPSFIEVRREKEGSYFTTGLIPAKPDSELVARFGVAWFTDKKGRKHVRVAADVIKVKSWESPVLWPRHLPPYSLVYPSMQEREIKVVFIKCKCGREGTLEDMDWNGRVCGVCQEKERYEAETGFQPGR